MFPWHFLKSGISNLKTPPGKVHGGFLKSGISSLKLPPGRVHGGSLKSGISNLKLLPAECMGGSLKSGISNLKLPPGRVHGGSLKSGISNLKLRPPRERAGPLKDKTLPRSSGIRGRELEETKSVQTLNSIAYAELLAKVQPHPIKNEREYDRFVVEVERLRKRGEETLSAEEGSLLAMLSLLIEEYRRRHYPLSSCPPHKVLAFFLERRGLEPRDLWRVLGSKTGGHLPEGSRILGVGRYGAF
jgi:HTH-type transcriptional regulator/antitoxin HigA